MKDVNVRDEGSLVLHRKGLCCLREAWVLHEKLLECYMRRTKVLLDGDLGVT